MNVSKKIRDEFERELSIWLNDAHATKDEFITIKNEYGKRVRYIPDGDWRMYPPKKLQSINYYYQDKKNHSID